MEPERILTEPERFLMEPERFLTEPNFAQVPLKFAWVPLKIIGIFFNGNRLELSDLNMELGYKQREERGVFEVKKCFKRNMERFLTEPEQI